MFPGERVISGLRCLTKPLATVESTSYPCMDDCCRAKETSVSSRDERHVPLGAYKNLCFTIPITMRLDEPPKDNSHSRSSKSRSCSDRETTKPTTMEGSTRSLPSQLRVSRNKLFINYHATRLVLVNLEPKMSQAKYCKRCQER